MGEINSMELHLIQSPESVWQGGPDPLNRGYNRDLLRYFRKKGATPVDDIGDFVRRVLIEASSRSALIRKLVIGSHGTGEPGNSGHFRLGKTVLMSTGCDAEFDYLRMLRGLFVKDAAVYILACRTGFATDLLRRLSQVWGGVRVYGYTDFITTTSYGFLGVSVDDGTSDEGHEIVCWSSVCIHGAGTGGWRPK